MTDARFAGQGFVYYDVQTSPDGSLEVLRGYSGGEKSATLVEPRVVSTATGHVIFDLWHTYQNYELHFDDNGNATLTVQNMVNGRERVADISFRESVFSFRDAPTVKHALAKLSELASLF